MTFCSGFEAEYIYIYCMWFPEILSLLWKKNCSSKKKERGKMAVLHIRYFTIIIIVMHTHRQGSFFFRQIAAQCCIHNNTILHSHMILSTSLCYDLSGTKMDFYFGKDFFFSFRSRFFPPKYSIVICNSTKYYIKNIYYFKVSSVVF